MEIIAIANQKGGVGKTTTALNLSSALKARGERVLCLDFDPQCHLAKYLDYSPDGEPTITEFLFCQAAILEPPSKEHLIRKSKAGIDFIPCDLRLSKSDMVLNQALFPQRLLAEILPVLIPEEEYDFLIIDCNPSMGVLLTNALTAADSVLIPVQTEEFAADGLEDMMDAIQIIHDQLNRRLKVNSILPTMVMRTNVSRDVLTRLHTEYPDLVSSVHISRRNDAPKSCAQRKPLVGTKSLLSEEYMALADEILRRAEKESHG